MMEAIMTQKGTPLLKCFVLFLFIFTAKVLTSRPNEVHDSGNGIQHVKPSHYVRTFTKYHHRRTIQWNNHELQNYWPVTQDQPKVIGKRSVNSDWPKMIRKRSIQIPYSNRFKRNRRSADEFFGKSVPDLNQFNLEGRDNENFDKKAISSGKEGHTSKNVVSEVRKYKVKAAIVITDAPTTIGPTISCLYKIHSVAKSVTPSYSDEKNAQLMVENDSYDTGAITSTELPSGPTQIEKCTDPKATCYTLWHQDNDGNITVLGQGCWRSSPQIEGQGPCDKCTRVTARLPGTKFCCCTKSFCNADFTSLREETVTMKAESTMLAPPATNKYLLCLALAALALAAMLVTVAVLRTMHTPRDDSDDDAEKASLREETVTMKAESTMLAPPATNKYLLCLALAALALTAMLVTVAVLRTMHTPRDDSDDDAEKASLREETVTMKAESTMLAPPATNKYLLCLALAALALTAMLVTVAVLRTMHTPRDDDSDDAEKGDVMGSGPDALATGLLCVDNLTLIEHIGQGKFGSVWRGSLGGSPVAVKLCASAAVCRREAAIYALPQLAHRNILKYYGSDTRPTLTEGGGREHLIVLELCTCTLRTRLERSQLTWVEFASLAHGIASALSHLHTPMGNKPCIVHRDVNSNNVLISSDGTCRLSDLGLAQALPTNAAHSQPTRYTEAGTLRYLAPEALEGALDLSGAGAALCAVDVYALSLVLWELLWRTGGAHRGGRAPQYTPPYHPHLPSKHTIATMQNLVSRNKIRPPLPKGPVPEWRALKIACDTCEECWDHDAEARLTAVCVEERMSELKQLVSTQPPLIHDNKLQTHPPVDPQPEAEKNCNCTVSCDVNRPLLSDSLLTGRNACLARNTHTAVNTHVPLLHTSRKDVPHTTTEPPRQNIEENCLSVARISYRQPIQENSLNEIRSYQRPLDYIPNDVSSLSSERAPKQTNLLHNVKIEKPKWGIRKFFEKLNRKETEVKLLPESSQKTKTTIIEKPMNVEYQRPSNLVLDEERERYYEAPCISPPNKTLSPTMMDQGFKELPPRDNDPKTPNLIFAVIVPKAQIHEVKRNNSSESINKSVVSRTSMSSQSMFKSNSESEDSTVKKRLSDNKITNSASSSRASINLELKYIDNTDNFNQISPFDLTDTSSSEDENLMLLSENGGSKITMTSIPKEKDVLKESSQTKTDFTTNKLNKYANFDNEYSDPNDKENLVAYSVDNPLYLAALNGEISTDLKLFEEEKPKPCLKNLSIKRQHSLEQVSDLFSSAGDINLLNPAGRVKTPGDLPVAVRRARSRALQKGRANETNRLSLYDDRMMFGNSL